MAYFLSTVKCRNTIWRRNSIKTCCKWHNFVRSKVKVTSCRKIPRIVGLYNNPYIDENVSRLSGNVITYYYYIRYF